MIATHRPPAARAFTLAEAVVSTVIVAVMLLAAMNTLGAARIGESKIAQRYRGLHLARDLMAEILRQNYADPDDGVASFGLELKKVGDGSRALWDDVDDYDGWSASPPQLKDGTEMTDLDGWERSVEVEWMSPWNLSLGVGSNQGVKRITVTVEHNGFPVASLVAFRTGARWSVASMRKGGATLK